MIISTYEVSTLHVSVNKNKVKSETVKIKQKLVQNENVFLDSITSSKRFGSFVWFKLIKFSRGLYDYTNTEACFHFT